MTSSSRISPRSTIGFVRSIGITSPVSSSSKSSTQVLRTLAASLRPLLASRFSLLTSISSARLKISMISLSLLKPMARRRVVTGNFFLRSMYAYITLLMSVANSIQEPLKGMIRAEYSLVPLACILWSKNTPGERWSWDTMIRSEPLMTKVPAGVIYGILPRNTSCTLVSKSSCSGSVQERRSFAFIGTL